MQANRVVIIGDVVSGYRFHGPFLNNAEAFAYVKRYAEPGQRGTDNSRVLTLANFDTMTKAEISKYEREVGHGVFLLEGIPLEDDIPF